LQALERKHRLVVALLGVVPVGLVVALLGRRPRLGMASGRVASRLGLGLGLACCRRNRLRSGKLLRLVLALEWMRLGERLLRAPLRISVLLVSHRVERQSAKTCSVNRLRQTTASPSMMAERTLSRITAWTISGKRWLQLNPRRVEPDAIAIAPDDQPISVVLDLMDPVRPIGRSRLLRGEARHGRMNIFPLAASLDRIDD
jgi:hypothetical protein